MAVDTSIAPLVPGPRTPYALYPELSSEHRGFLWRAGYKRASDPGGRYTSEYQRQFQPINAEGQKELDNSRKETRARAPVADMREVLREVEGVTEVPKVPKVPEVPVPNVLVPERPVETLGGYKRSAKKSEKRAAKRPKKDRSSPFPLSEYQAQFQAWDRLMKQTSSCSPVREIAKQTPVPLPPSFPPCLQRSPTRWSSEYRSNFSLRSSDVTETPSSWYQMVVELRQRARAYRDRGRSSVLEAPPLSDRCSQVSGRSEVSSRPLPSPPRSPPPQGHTRDSGTQVSARPREQKSAVDQLGGSLTKLKVSIPTDQLLEAPNLPVSNTLPASCQHEAARARTAVPPIDINRVRSYPSGAYSSPPGPSSLQEQLFRYKERAPPPDPDQLSAVSAVSAVSLASNTLDRARHRQTFWK